MARWNLIERRLERFMREPPSVRNAAGVIVVATTVVVVGAGAVLRRLGAPSYPAGRAWDEPIERARKEGRFRLAGEPNGAEQVICATGFKRGFVHDPLLARLAADYGLKTVEGWLVLAPDATVAQLTDSTRTLAVAGAPGQWAFPAADTLAGAKYAARRFLRRNQACPTR